MCQYKKTEKQRIFRRFEQKIDAEMHFLKTLPKNNVFLQEQCYNVTKEKHCTYGDRLIRGEENGI